MPRRLQRRYPPAFTAPTIECIRYLVHYAANRRNSSLTLSNMNGCLRFLPFPLTDNVIILFLPSRNLKSFSSPHKILRPSTYFPGFGTLRNGTAIFVLRSNKILSCCLVVFSDNEYVVCQLTNLSDILRRDIHFV